MSIRHEAKDLRWGEVDRVCQWQALVYANVQVIGGQCGTARESTIYVQIRKGIDVGGDFRRCLSHFENAGISLTAT